MNFIFGVLLTGALTLAAAAGVRAGAVGHRLDAFILNYKNHFFIKTISYLYCRSIILAHFLRFPL